MTAIRKRSPVVGRRSKLGIAALYLISGVLAEQAVSLRAQEKPAEDVIVFTNGDQLTGKLERSIGDSIIFKSDAVGEITVSMDKVKELRSNGSFAVLKKGEKVTRTSKIAGTIAYADKSITVTKPNGTPETVDRKDLAYIVDSETYNKEVIRNPGFFSGWAGSVSGGITLIRSTQTGSNYNAEVNLVRAIPTVPFLPARTRTTFDLLETYGKLTNPVIPQTTPPSPPEVAKSNVFHADAEHDRYFTSRVYALVGTSFDHNYAQGLNLQQIYGAGIGATVLQQPAQELDVKADVHYERQNFQPPTVSENLIGSTFTEAYHRDLPAKLVFTESGSYIQSWNDFKAYSAVASTGLQLPVYKRFSMSVNALDNYLNNPAAGYKKNSFQFLTNIVYTLK
jgi:hypothetical protein